MRSLWERWRSWIVSIVSNEALGDVGYKAISSNSVI